MLFTGTKYPVQVRNYSKSSTSVMMCGSAAGVLLPPYIIYKSDFMYSTWRIVPVEPNETPPYCNKSCCQGKFKFNRSKSGWIDPVIFTDWFINQFLPHAKLLPGPKVLMGDNLSSHFTDEVISNCIENDIRFVCLVPNSTHLTQPLDVGFFRPVKEAWRTVIGAYKKANVKIALIPKNDFARILKKCLFEMDTVKTKNIKSKTYTNRIYENLKSAFKKCGVVPFNPKEVLMQLPDYVPTPTDDESSEDENPLTQQPPSAVETPSTSTLQTPSTSALPTPSTSTTSTLEDLSKTQTSESNDVHTQETPSMRNVLVNFLKEARFGNQEKPKSRGRGKRVNVVPGRSVSSLTPEEAVPPPKVQKKKKKKHQSDTDEEEDVDNPGEVQPNETVSENKKRPTDKENFADVNFADVPQPNETASKNKKRPPPNLASEMKIKRKKLSLKEKNIEHAAKIDSKKKKKPEKQEEKCAVCNESYSRPGEVSSYLKLILKRILMEKLIIFYIFQEWIQCCEKSCQRWTHLDCSGANETTKVYICIRCL